MQNDITVRKLEVQHLPSDYPRDDVFDLAATISRVKNYDDAQYEDAQVEKPAFVHLVDPTPSIDELIAHLNATNVSFVLLEENDEGDRTAADYADAEPLATE
jgi:hypothetical protein